MNKLLFLLLFVTQSVFSQDRLDSEFPKIIDTIFTIKSATGWMKNDIGKWTSKRNAIPSEFSNLNLNCSEFTEFQLLKLSYNQENYFCIVHKSKMQNLFYVFNFFQAPKKILSDTIVNLNFQTVCIGTFYGSAKFKTTLLNEIFKQFQNEYNMQADLQISILTNKQKKYLRFYISADSYSAFCGEEENPLERKYFEAQLSNIKFFEPLISEN